MKFKVMLTDEAKEDLKELAPDYQKLVKDDFNTIEKVGLEYVARKQLEKKLFEIKSGNVRSLYTYSKDQLMIIGVIFLKKSQKTPEIYKKRAKKILEL